MIALFAWYQRFWQESFNRLERYLRKLQSKEKTK